MAEYAKDYTIDELMAAALAREIRNGETVFQTGTPFGMVAAQLARLTHAPNVIYAYYYALDPPLYNVGGEEDDPEAMCANSIKVLGAWDEYWGLGLRGKIDVMMVAPVQVDRYGNANISFIGDPDKPKAVFIGPVGLPEVMAYANRVLMYETRHERRVFVEKVDFITGMGHVPGGLKARRELGVPGRGPEKIVTNLAVLGFDEDTGLMRLETLHPGVSVEDVRANTSFDLVIPKSIPQTELPTVEQVELMRNKIDPLGIRKMGVSAAVAAFAGAPKPSPEETSTA